MPESQINMQQSNHKAERAEKKVLVVSTIESESTDIVRLLKAEGYFATAIDSLSALEHALEQSSLLAVLIDVDSIAVDNRVVRTLAMKNPEMGILSASSSRIHPELKDAISQHIYACLAKPVDPDELLYCLKSIGKNQIDSRAPP